MMGAALYKYRHQHICASVLPLQVQTRPYSLTRLLRRDIASWSSTNWCHNSQCKDTIRVRGVSIDTLWVVLLGMERRPWFQVEAIQLHSGIELVALMYGRRFVSCRSREMIGWSMRSCGHYDIALRRITATISEVHTYIDPRLDGVRQGHSTYELSVGLSLIDRPRR